jgi:hypothetical protein
MINEINQIEKNKNMKGHKSIIKVSKKMTRKKKKLSKASLMIMKSLELKTRYQ